MQNTAATLRVALRVLAAVIERAVPDPLDLAELRLNSELQAGADIDEMAREVILGCIWSLNRGRKGGTMTAAA